MIYTSVILSLALVMGQVGWNCTWGESWRDWMDAFACQDWDRPLRSPGLISLFTDKDIFPKLSQDKHPTPDSPPTEGHAV
jgi:hypothetical protein